MSATDDQSEVPLHVRVKAALAGNPADTKLDSDVEQALRVLAADAPVGRRRPLMVLVLVVLALLLLGLFLVHGLF